MFINIHTHQLQGNQTDCLEVQSLYADFGEAATGAACSLGLHPWHLENLERQFEELRQFARLNNVLAIGECGLDKVCATDWAVQEKVFRKQVELAKVLVKPIIIHCVRAYPEILKVLDEMKPGVAVIFHGFNRKMEVAEDLLRYGYYLSFGNAILNEGPVANVLSVIPTDRFFLETDDALISIKEIYQRAATIRNTSVDAIILQVEKNFKNVFKYEMK